MKLLNILLGQAVRLMKISAPGGGTIYGLNLAKACEERYGFLQAPRTLADYDASKGITFLHGYFQNKVVIDKFQVFENGLLVEAKVDTDECDAFLDDVMNWTRERGGIEFSVAPDAPRLYLSQLEVQSAISLPQAFPKLAPFGRQIADVLRSYRQIMSDWEFSGLSFGTAASGDASSFKFERRDGQAVPRDVYFASARMRTKDHLSILENLETML
jgi:hypothetical protein